MNWLAKRLNRSSNEFYYAALAFIAVLLFALFSLDFGVSFFITRPTITSSLLFVTGYVLTKTQFMQRVTNVHFALCLVVIIIAGRVYYPGISGLRQVTPVCFFPYYLLSITGSIMMLKLSSYLASTSLSSLFDWLGCHTLEVLTWHFLSFKLASWVKVKCYPSLLTIDNLADFPIIKLNNDYFWLLYTAVGILVPMLIAWSGTVLKAKMNLCVR